MVIVAELLGGNWLLGIALAPDPAFQLEVRVRERPQEVGCAVHRCAPPADRIA